MPVLQLSCPDCGNAFRSLVIEGAKVPEVWICSRCGSRRAAPRESDEQVHHPWADGSPSCSCCG